MLGPLLLVLHHVCLGQPHPPLLLVHADIDTVKVVVKNVPDYAAGKEKNDLGFLTFDLQVV